LLISNKHFGCERASSTKAAKSLEMASTLNPTYASAYILLGQTYGRLGETAKSQAAFQKARSLLEKEIQDMHE
jgi:Tfp pilus assembly protein PilF